MLCSIDETRRKVKGEQMITLRMAQRIKTEN